MTEPRVRIVQLLCPQRHAILAVAYLSRDGSADPRANITLRFSFKTSVRKGLLNPWCGLCRSEDLHTEDSATQFATMEEAAPHLKASEQDQAQTRAILESQN